MASDLSSNCTEVIEILDEKEEGEISLEDVSSSEEGQVNEAYNSKNRVAVQCTSSMSAIPWCNTSKRNSQPKNLATKDAVHEKENCHHTKESGHSASKHSATTLQEKNNDLIPISSDSDMEIVGLAENTKEASAPKQAAEKTVHKRRRKRRSQNTSTVVEKSRAHTVLDSYVSEVPVGKPRDLKISKNERLPRTRHKESSSPHKGARIALSTTKISNSLARRKGSPLQSRSPITAAKSLARRSRSPISRVSPSSYARSSAVRRPISSRYRSPIPRSPHRSPDKPVTRRPTRRSESPTNTYIDMYGNVNKLLKKVRQSTHRDSSRQKIQGSSLKEKINNMIKIGDGSENAVQNSTELYNKIEKVEDDNDDEDLTVLRQRALETKSKRLKETRAIQVETTTTKIQGGSSNNDDDDDIEDLELRMIALRSAMLKKHQNRLQRGLRQGKSKKSTGSSRANTESPLSESFLDGVTSPSIDGDGSRVPSVTPTRNLTENTNAEDMELDSEVELEKQKETEPYSPTDEISHQITIEPELLGNHSDVKTIQPTTPPNCTRPKSLLTENLSSTSTRTSNSFGIQASVTNSIANENAYYSLDYSSMQLSTSLESTSHSVSERLRPNSSLQLDNNLQSIPYSSSQPIDSSEMILPHALPFYEPDCDQILNSPYSPTDTPIYDPDTKSASSVVDSSSTQACSIRTRINNAVQHEFHKPYCDSHITISGSLTKLDGTQETSHAGMATVENDPSDAWSMKADVGSVYNSPNDSVDSSMITVDELPETDLDGSPLVPLTNQLCDIEIHIPASMSQETVSTAQEPLYLQGVPDVTKDVNKIPTLVNRSLVPASILKSNKNLQQPLPQKKLTTPPEPAFKSAQMQPVQIAAEPPKTNTLFKPIKLASVTKKPNLQISRPAAFNGSFGISSPDDENKSNPVDSNTNLHAISVTSSEQDKNTEPVKTDAVHVIAKKYQPSNTSTTSVEKQSVDTSKSMTKKNVTEDASSNSKKHTKKKRSSMTTTGEKEYIENPSKRTKTGKKAMNDRRTESDNGKYRSSTNTPQDRIRNSNEEDRSIPKRRHSSDVQKSRDVMKMKRNVKSLEPDEAKLIPETNATDHMSEHLNTDIVVKRSSKSSELDDKRMRIPIESTSDAESKSLERIQSDPSVKSKEGVHSTLPNANCQKIDINKRRRSSLDEDEDALRASLLASLAKRSKPTTAIVPTSKDNTTPSVSHNSTIGVKDSSKLPQRDEKSRSSTTVNHTLGVNNINTSKPMNQNESPSVNPVTSFANASLDDKLQSSRVTTLNSSITENKAPQTPIEDQSMLSSMSMRRKSIVTNPKISQKRVVKKFPISASAKVVNNAKKFQNTLVQKKLSLQKVASLTNVQPIVQTKLNVTKTTDEIRPKTNISQTLSDTKRFVINLASDSESEVEPETVTKNHSRSENANDHQPKPVLMIPMSDFEKSVDLFLKDVRQKQETTSAVKPVPKKIIIGPKPALSKTPIAKRPSIASTTPSAVRHLPLSLQEEYRRLKQQILEREKLKLQRTIVNRTPPPAPSSNSVSTGPLSPADSATAKQSVSGRTISTPAVATSAKDSVSKVVTLTSLGKNTLPNANAKVIAPSVNKNVANPLPNLNIVISNKPTSIDSAEQSGNSITFNNAGQVRTVFPVKVPQVSLKKNDLGNAGSSMRDPQNFEPVQVQLIQGMTGRTVSLGDNPNMKKNSIRSQHTQSDTKLLANDNRVNSKKTDDTSEIGSSHTLLDVELTDKKPESSTNDKINSCSTSAVSNLSMVTKSETDDICDKSTLINSQASTIVHSKNESDITYGSTTQDSMNSHDKSNAVKEKERPKHSKATLTKITDDVKKEIDVITALPVDEQKSYLLTLEQDLVTKRYAVLDDLSKISGSLQQLETEREIQVNLSVEVKRLQEQLKQATHKLQMQRNRINLIVPEVTVAYEKVNKVRKECAKMTRICLGLGSIVIGDNYKIPAAGAHLMNNRLKQVAGCTRQLAKKTKISEETVTEDSYRAIQSDKSGINLRCPFDISPTVECENRIAGVNDPPSVENITAARVHNDSILEIETNTNSTPEEVRTPKQKIEKMDDRLDRIKDGNISEHAPRRTSTPNCSKDTHNISLFVRHSDSSIISDRQETSLLRPKDPTTERCRFLQPYKSVLTHLTTSSSATTDPNGVLCPYELMGTCRDDDCQFVHHSTRTS